MELDRDRTGIVVYEVLPRLLALNFGKVKEGTENRGSIEAVVRLVRKTASPTWPASRTRFSFVLAAENAPAGDSSPKCQAAGAPWLGDGRRRKLCSPHTQPRGSPKVFPKSVSVVTIIFSLFTTLDIQNYPISRALWPHSSGYTSVMSFWVSMQWYPYPPFHNQTSLKKIKA